MTDPNRSTPPIDYAQEFAVAAEDDDGHPPLYVSETPEFDLLPRPDRRYPVVLEVTERRILWVTADSHDAAVRAVKDPDGCSIDWDRAEPTDSGGLSITEAYWARYEIDDALRERSYGPQEACPECGAVAPVDSTYPTALRYAPHAGDCSRHRHRPELEPVYARHDDGTVSMDTSVGYWVACSCGGNGSTVLARFTSIGSRVHGDPGVPAPYPTREAAAAVARGHVEGRPHGTQYPLGILGDIDLSPEDLRRREAVTSRG